MEGFGRGQGSFKPIGVKRERRLSGGSRTLPPPTAGSVNVAGSFPHNYLPFPVNSIPIEPIRSNVMSSFPRIQEYERSPNPQQFHGNLHASLPQLSGGSRTLPPPNCRVCECGRVC
jgi:hypothetical protein